MSFSWPELYFIRHGETDWNAEGRYQGSRDIPLNDKGRSQADRNGELLHRMLQRANRPATDFNWYVSPLSRARETMERVRARFPGPLPEVIADPRLVEISFGIYEGRLQSELGANEMASSGARDAAFWDFRPPGGESYEDVANRIRSFAQTLQGPSIVVAHGGILRILRRLIEDFPIDKAVNWFPRQDVVAHFVDGQLTFHDQKADA